MVEQTCQKNETGFMAEVMCEYEAKVTYWRGIYFEFFLKFK